MGFAEEAHHPELRTGPAPLGRSRSPIYLFTIRSDCSRSPKSAVKEVLTESGLPAVPEEIEVRDAIEAEQLCFPGSPTVRVDGEDIEAGVQDRREYALICRMYKTAGIPPRELLLATFRRGG